MIKQTNTAQVSPARWAELPVHLAVRPLDREDPLSAVVIPGDVNSNQVLYRIYDADQQPLYIGRTTSVWTRLPNHRRNARWWAEAEFLAISVYDTPDKLAEAERAALRNERPRWNAATVNGPANVHLPLRTAEAAAAVLFREALPELIAELAELLQQPERFPQFEPPPPARADD